MPVQLISLAPHHHAAVFTILPEQDAMEKYIQETLQQGYICPSTSRASAGFFFVEKKEGASDPALIIVY